MPSILPLAIAALLSIAVVLLLRALHRDEAGPTAPRAQPPQVLTNLPQVEKVDIRALFSKWED